MPRGRWSGGEPPFQRSPPPCSPWRARSRHHHLLARIEWLLSRPSDRPEVRATKLWILFVSAVLSVVGSLWGALYVCLGAGCAAWFPFTMVFLSLVAAALLFYRRETVLPCRVLCFGVCLHALGVHWSFGGNSSSVINWALLAPQCVFFAGGRSWAGWFLISVVAGLLSVYFCLGAVLDVRTLTPEQAVVPAGWVVAFEFINILLPWFASFTVAWYGMRHVQQQRRLLEHNLAKAEGLAQRIIDFDLDGIQATGSDEGTVVALLSQVAFNLKLYRPYLPPHLMHPQTSEDGSFGAELLPDAPPDDAASGNHWAAMAGDLPLPLGDKGRSLSMRGLLGSPKALRAPHASFEIDHQVRCGTLLYFHLGDLSFPVRDIGQAEQLDMIRRTSSMVSQVVMDALKEHHGTLLYLQHNCGLMCWNFISRCRSHAINACLAALSIRDILHSALERCPGMLPLQVSMGLWSGVLVSGSFGTEDFKTSSAIGPGITRVADLQHYAATHRRSIVLNAEAFRHLNSQKLRLLPVDVLATGRQQARLDYLVSPAPSELVYELVEEVRVAEDEWMYQLQTVEHANESERKLEELFKQMQVGISDLQLFIEEVTALIRSPDQRVSDVALHLRTLVHEDSHLANGKPYFVLLFQYWFRCALPFSDAVTSGSLDRDFSGARWLPVPARHSTSSANTSSTSSKRLSLPSCLAPRPLTKAPASFRIQPFANSPWAVPVTDMMTSPR